jgi:hypothetical protein
MQHEYAASNTENFSPIGATFGIRHQRVKEEKCKT